MTNPIPDLSPLAYFTTYIPSLYDATAGGSLTGSNAEVLRWEDQSGNSRHVIQSGAGKRPLRIVGAKNGMDAVRFDGSNDSLELATFPSGLGNVSIFAVMKWNSGGATEDLPVAIGTAGQSKSVRSFYRNANGTTLGFAAWGNDQGSSSLSLDIGGGYHVFAATLSTASLVLTVDGSSASSSLPSTPSSTTAGLGLGGIYNSVNYNTACDICEVVIFGSSLSTTNRQSVERYLGSKWGITVA